MGPLFKFTEFEFCHAAAEDGDGAAKLKTAIASAREAHAAAVAPRDNGILNYLPNHIP